MHAVPTAGTATPMLVIAHRGAKVRAPENTIDAFEAAFEDGADGIEFDVRLTKDGVPVLVHDDSFTDGTGHTGRISSTEWSVLREVVLDTGATVPTLTEGLAVMRGRGLIIAEVKPVPVPGGGAGATPVLEVAAPLLAGVEDVVVASFDPAALLRSHELLRGVRTALTGYRSGREEWLIRLASNDGHAYVSVPTHDVDAAFVQDAHAAGIEIIAWTPEPAEVRALAALGLDVVIVDDPAGVRAALPAG